MINNAGPIRYMPCTNETHVRIVKEKSPMSDGIKREEERGTERERGEAEEAGGGGGGGRTRG